MARSISDRLDSSSEAWCPEAGDKLIGEVIAVNTNDGGYGPYKVVTVEVADPGSTEQGGQPIAVGDERAFHAFHTVAANELASVRVGDEIGVKYLGETKTRDGEQTFHNYRVVGVGQAPDEPEAEAGTAPRDDDIPF